MAKPLQQMEQKGGLARAGVGDKGQKPPVRFNSAKQRSERFAVPRASEDDRASTATLPRAVLAGWY